MNKIIDAEVRALMDSAATGMAAKDFINSGLGQHIVQRASEEIEEALAELVEIEPDQAPAIAAIQRRVHHARGAISWLMDAITSGEHAMRTLDDLEQSDS